jgi:hypothetical protein
MFNKPTSELSKDAKVDYLERLKQEKVKDKNISVFTLIDNEAKTSKNKLEYDTHCCSATFSPQRWVG